MTKPASRPITISLWPLSKGSDLSEDGVDRKSQYNLPGPTHRINIIQTGALVDNLTTSVRPPFLRWTRIEVSEWRFAYDDKSVEVDLGGRVIWSETSQKDSSIVCCTARERDRLGHFTKVSRKGIASIYEKKCQRCTLNRTFLFLYVFVAKSRRQVVPKTSICEISTEFSISG